MRKSLSLVLFLGLAGASVPSRAQITGGHETVADAIRFERQKQAAADRQARIEAGNNQNTNADRSVTGSDQTRGAKTRRNPKGSAARTAPSDQSGQKQVVAK